VVQLEILPEDKVANDPTHDNHASDRIDRRWLVQTREFHGNDHLTEVAATEIQWTRRSDGMNEPVAVQGGDFTIPADIALLAVGFNRTVDENLAGQLGLTTDDDGGMFVERYSTSVDGVFAAGDTVSGPALVVNAIRSGRKAAAQINSYLGR
jgi:NADPH-dependent glutamate synthase beta subunit-like oxidoreductase